MTDLTTIQSLRDRVAKATGPDREIDRDTAVAFNVFQERFGIIYHWCEAGSTVNPVYNSQLPQYTASIDDALAWVERMLPGKWPHLLELVLGTGDIVDENGECQLSRMPLAIILAGLDALIVKEEIDDQA